MTNTRLTNLITISCENDIKINYDNIIDNFMSSKTCKCIFTGCRNI